MTREERMTKVVMMCVVLLGITFGAQMVVETQETYRIDVSTLGPQVGEPVPDFRLPDQTGTVRTLQSIMGRRGAVIVFVRSTDWCPYCKTQVVELQGRVEALRAQGLGLAVISYDPQEVHARFSRERGITFPLLADAGSATIRRYGILNTVVDLAMGDRRDDPQVRAAAQLYVSGGAVGARHQGIPFPGTFIVDRRGRVTARFFEDYYAERTTMSNLLVRAGAGGEAVPATRASTAHLDVTAYASDGAVAPGNRLALTLEIAPKPGMHVYAPGARGYRVLTLEVAPESFLRMEPVRYPASEIYHFKPLDERVPVFRKPFRVVREVVVKGDAQAQAALRGREAITIDATLEYQACDDAVCFNPVSLPLTWTLQLRSLIRDAPPSR
jgi:peroxiredoxin